MPAKRERLRPGAGVPAVSPPSPLATPCSQRQAGTAAAGCPWLSASSPRSSPRAGTAAGSGVRMLSPAGGAMSVSRSLVHGAEPAARAEGSEPVPTLSGERRPLQSASNCRSICEESGMVGGRAAPGRGLGSGSLREPPAAGRGPGDTPGVTLVARLATGPGLPRPSCCRRCRVTAKMWSRERRSEHISEEMAHMDLCGPGSAAEPGVTARRRDAPARLLAPRRWCSPSGRCRWGPPAPG